MTVSINGTSGLVFNDASTQATAATGFGFKNRILNGSMVLDQRNAGASVTPTDGQYTLDRWQASLSASSKFSVQQNAGSVTPPSGFTNYLGVTSLSAYSVGSTETFAIQQKIEGFNIADLGFGTANAKTITLSFQVYSSLTGTFGGALSTGGYARSYPFSYSIPVANTWTTISITIAGDTSGTYATGNTEGLRLAFSLGSGTTRSGTAGSWSSSVFTNATGATSVVGTNGATFYITGVQLEKGFTATSFDYRPYTTEELLCYRYYWQQNYTQTYESILDPARAGATNTAYGTFYFPIPMRTAPTVGNNGVGNFRLNDSKGHDQTCNGITVPYNSSSKAVLVFSKATGDFTVSDCVYVNAEATNDAALYFNAEL